jgi:hypothetical protein
MEEPGEDEFVVLVFGNYELVVTNYGKFRTQREMQDAKGNSERKERKEERKGTQRNTICF